MTGLDVVPAMLERARFKAEAAGLSVRWVEDDARRFDLDSERFRLIFLTGNAFQAFLTNADQEALLGRVRAHLHDEGLFAFETRNPRWRTSEGRDEARRPVGLPGDSCGGGGAAAHTDAHGREVRESRLHLRPRRPGPALDFIPALARGGGQERTKTTRIALRYTFPQELAALVHLAASPSRGATASGTASP